MLTYQNKKGVKRYLVQGNVFDNVEDLRLFLLKDKDISPNAVSVYLNKHLETSPVTKKVAVAHIKEFTGISNKKATEMLS